MKAQAINTDYLLKTLLIGKTIYPNGGKQISVHTNDEWYGIGNTKTETNGRESMERRTNKILTRQLPNN